MTILMDTSAIAIYKLKQPKLITKILRSDQANYTSLCTPTWSDPSILSISWARNTFSPLQTMALG